jgi:hypothetical protein
MQSAFNISWWQRINIPAVARIGSRFVPVFFSLCLHLHEKERQHAHTTLCGLLRQRFDQRHEEQTTLRALLLLFCPDVVFQQTHAFHHAE